MKVRFFIIFCLALIFCGILQGYEFSDKGRSYLKINIFSQKNGKGLERDAKILYQAIKALHHSCQVYDFYTNNKSVKSADINIFFQLPISNLFSKAEQNWLIPNPEWYTQDIALLSRLDLIVCRTYESQRIFNALNCPTFYLGFTSIDRYDPAVVRYRKQPLHVAGGSFQKGTPIIFEIWRRRNDFPILYLVKSTKGIPNLQNIEGSNKYIPDDTLRDLQNESGIHLCPSETEGFGHYIMEAMSTKAVVITTDAPPMNEFIQDPRCLAAYASQKMQRLGVNYYVDADSLEKTIEKILSLSDEELDEIGERNREAYLQRTREFEENLQNLLEGIQLSRTGPSPLLPTW